MEPCIRFFAIESEELKPLVDKLYRDPDALSNATELWKNIFEYLYHQAEASMYFDGQCLYSDEPQPQPIKITKFIVQGENILLTEDISVGLDLELMEGIVDEILADYFSGETRRNMLIFEASVKTLKLLKII